MQVSRIDHVHIEVADRKAAADWYDHVLGLKRHDDLHIWAEHPMGPLILQGGDGAPALSLFERASQKVSRDTTVAFRVTGAAFLSFCNDLQSLDLKDRSGAVVTPTDVIDHQFSWSLYFVDPDQNPLELTTYDYDLVANARVTLGGEAE